MKLLICFPPKQTRFLLIKYSIRNGICYLYRFAFIYHCVAGNQALGIHARAIIDTQDLLTAKRAFPTLCEIVEHVALLSFEISCYTKH